MKKKSNGCFIIGSAKGLHTHPSTEIVRCASKFLSDISLIYQGTRVDAKSLSGVLALCAVMGATIHVEAEGEDAQEAVDAIIALAHSQFKID